VTPDQATRLRALLTELGDLLVETTRVSERRVDDLYTLPEVAERLRISRMSVRRLIDRRELPTLTVGGRRFVSETQLATFIEHRSAVSE
jgi:excisionase family DNA binding protein